MTTGILSRIMGRKGPVAEAARDAAEEAFIRRVSELV